MITHCSASSVRLGAAREHVDSVSSRINTYIRAPEQSLSGLSLSGSRLRNTESVIGMQYGLDTSLGMHLVLDRRE